MNIRKTIINAVCALAIAASSITASAASFADESLNYKVTYKWGLVNKQAGTATLTLRNSGSNYVAKLTARSDPWADKFYRVRDTLTSTIKRDGFKPLRYEKIAHEGDESKRDVVTYKYTNAKVIGECTRRKWDEDGTLKIDEKRTLESYGTTVDMLSSFYYMRDLPYSTWKANHVVTLNIYSGKRKELLTIKYLGVETVKYDNKSFKCYHISFTFTSDGKTKTSDDMDAWISTDDRHIPVKLEGSLKVGKVRCFYTGSN
jgi:hypothetical protein